MSQPDHNTFPVVFGVGNTLTRRGDIRLTILATITHLATADRVLCVNEDVDAAMREIAEARNGLDILMNALKKEQAE